MELIFRPSFQSFPGGMGILFTPRSSRLFITITKNNLKNTGGIFKFIGRRYRRALYRMTWPYKSRRPSSLKIFLKEPFIQPWKAKWTVIHHRASSSTESNGISTCPDQKKGLLTHPILTARRHFRTDSEIPRNFVIKQLSVALFIVTFLITVITSNKTV